MEGAELDVLEGMRMLLGMVNAPDIICEVSRHDDKILDLLHNNSYKVYILDEQGNTSPYERKVSLRSKNLLFSKS